MGRTGGTKCLHGRAGKHSYWHILCIPFDVIAGSLIPVVKTHFGLNYGRTMWAIYNVSTICSWLAQPLLSVALFGVRAAGITSHQS